MTIIKANHAVSAATFQALINFLFAGSGIPTGAKIRYEGGHIVLAGSQNFITVVGAFVTGYRTAWAMQIEADTDAL
jgi:hypothetical protein